MQDMTHDFVDALSFSRPARLGWGETSEPQHLGIIVRLTVLGFASLIPTYAGWPGSVKASSGAFQVKDST
jgi:hypothetical protein